MNKHDKYVENEFHQRANIDNEFKLYSRGGAYSFALYLHVHTSSDTKDKMKDIILNLGYVR